MTTIHMPSSGTIHGMEIGKREAALSKSLIPRIYIPPVGKWAKSIHERIFETSTVLTATVDVTGWLEMDGLGLFSSKLDPEEDSITVGLPKDPIVDDATIKVAKDSHLSLVAEWGLSLKPLREETKQKKLDRPRPKKLSYHDVSRITSDVEAYLATSLSWGNLDSENDLHPPRTNPDSKE